MGRKLLPSLRDTTLRSFLNVIPNELVKTFNKASLTLTLKNGSEVWFRPLYDPEVLKSYEIAGFFIDEANEVDEEIYKRLKDRMRQKLRNGMRPRYQSIIALNPTEEDHWIPQLFFFQKPENHALFQSTTFDNMQHLPREYVKELEQMYSPDVLQRLLYGQFGKVHKGRPVYPQFSRGNHIYPLDFDHKLPLIRGWDFGYQHPACVFMQLDGSQVRVLGELMGKRTYLDDFVEDVVIPYQNLHFKNANRFLDYCDPHGADKTDKPKTSIQILNEKRIFPVYRRTYIQEGIKAVKRFLDTKDRQGNSNFIIHPRCKLLIEGLKGGYHRLDGDEDPEKDGYYDHCFAAGTLIDTARGPVPIEDVKERDLVLTRGGFQPVLFSGQTGVRPVMSLEFSNGAKLSCTPDHRIFTSNRGFVEAQLLTEYDELVTTQVWTPSVTREPSTEDIQTLKTDLLAATLDPLAGEESPCFFTEKSGKTTEDQSLQGTTSTTRMETQGITDSGILSAFQVLNTKFGMLPSAPNEPSPPSTSQSSTPLAHSQPSGTPQKPEEPGIKNTQSESGKIDRSSSLRSTALSAEISSPSKSASSTKQSSAEEHAERAILDADTVRLVARSLREKPEPVFDLTVENHHEFFAEGILVHNCQDALRYSLVFIEQRQRIHRLETMEVNVFIDPRTGRRIEYGT